MPIIVEARGEVIHSVGDPQIQLSGWSAAGRGNSRKGSSACVLGSQLDEPFWEFVGAAAVGGGTVGQTASIAERSASAGWQLLLGLFSALRTELRG